jgi:hypothetical protein
MKLDSTLLWNVLMHLVSIPTPTSLNVFYLFHSSPIECWDEYFCTTIYPFLRKFVDDDFGDTLKIMRC